MAGIKGLLCLASSRIFSVFSLFFHHVFDASTPFLPESMLMLSCFAVFRGNR